MRLGTLSGLFAVSYASSIKASLAAQDATESTNSLYPTPPNNDEAYILRTSGCESSIKGIKITWAINSEKTCYVSFSTAAFSVFDASTMTIGNSGRKRGTFQQGQDSENTNVAIATEVRIPDAPIEEFFKRSVTSVSDASATSRGSSSNTEATYFPSTITKELPEIPAVSSSTQQPEMPVSPSEKSSSNTQYVPGTITATLPDEPAAPSSTPEPNISKVSTVESSIETESAIYTMVDVTGKLPTTSAKDSRSASAPDQSQASAKEEATNTDSQTTNTTVDATDQLPDSSRASIPRPSFKTPTSSTDKSPSTTLSSIISSTLEITDKLSPASSSSKAPKKSLSSTPPQLSDTRPSTQKTVTNPRTPSKTEIETPPTSATERTITETGAPDKPSSSAANPSPNKTPAKQPTKTPSQRPSSATEPMSQALHSTSSQPISSATKTETHSEPKNSKHSSSATEPTPSTQPTSATETPSTATPFSTPDSSTNPLSLISSPPNNLDESTASGPNPTDAYAAYLSSFVAEMAESMVPTTTINTADIENISIWTVGPARSTG